MRVKANASAVMRGDNRALYSLVPGGVYDLPDDLAEVALASGLVSAVEKPAPKRAAKKNDEE